MVPGRDRARVKAPLKQIRLYHLAAQLYDTYKDILSFAMLHEAKS